MLQSIQYFCGRLFAWKKDSGDILIKKYIRNETCNDRFENEGIISVASGQRKNIRCTLQVAGEVMQTLFIIAEDKSERVGFVVSIHSVYRENNKWSVHDTGCFEVKESVIEKIHLSQDLTLIWNCHDTLNVLCCRSTWKSTDIMRIPCTEQLKEILLLHQIYVDLATFSDYKKVNILLVVVKTLTPYNDSGILFHALIVDSSDGAYNSQLLRLPMDYFIARFYASIISAINISRMNIGNGDNAFLAPEVTKNIGSNLNWSKNSTVVCTERKQFIVFISGCVHSICSIPFPDIYQIQNFKTYLPIRTYFVLQSLKGACAVKKCQFSKQLQVCNSWEDSMAVIVGDFMNSGTLQLLFASQLDQDLMMDSCVLTDIVVTFYPRTMPVVQNTNWNKDAIRGMNKTVMAGKIAFSEARRKQKEIQKVIDCTAERLEFAMSSDKSQKKICDSDLVDIIPPSEGSLLLEARKKEKLMAATNIVAMWKTVLQNQWILGWSLRNVSNMVLSNFNIHLGTQKETLEYVCKTYKHLSDIHSQPNLYFDEKYTGNLKQGELLSIVISLSPPVFTYEKLDITCAITWKNSPISHPSMPFNQQLSSQCQLCVQTALEKQDSFKELSVVQQLMSLRVLQDRLLLHFASEYTDLAQLEKMLALPLKHYPYVLSHLSSKINIFMNPISPLYGINFSINNSSPRETESVVHYREVKQLLLFVHWLHDSLPEDVNISAELVSISKLNEVLVPSMKEELQFIMSLTQMKNKINNVSLTDESDTNSLQCQLKNEHEHLLKNNLALSIQDYTEFRLQLLERECNNDDIIGEMIMYKQ